VQVTLHEARDLPVWGFPWQSNPYCRITLGSQAVQVCHRFTPYLASMLFGSAAAVRTAAGCQNQLCVSAVD
jgi:hypothetical protein